ALRRWTAAAVRSSRSQLRRHIHCEGFIQLHEFLVGLAVLQPNEHGKARGPVEHREGMVPSIQAISDALSGTGEECTRPRRVGASVGGFWRDDDEPTRHIEGEET